MVEVALKKLSLRDAIRLEESLQRDMERAVKYLDAIKGFGEDDAKYQIYKETVSKIEKTLAEVKINLELVSKALDGSVVEIPLSAVEYKGWDKASMDKEN